MVACAMLASSGSLSANCSACTRRADQIGSQLATFSTARIFCFRLTLHHPDIMLRGARGLHHLTAELEETQRPDLPCSGACKRILRLLRSLMVPRLRLRW